jgi:hypothetical protein
MRTNLTPRPVLLKSRADLQCAVILVTDAWHGDDGTANRGGDSLDGG